MTRGKRAAGKSTRDYLPGRSGRSCPRGGSACSRGDFNIELVVTTGALLLIVAASIALLPRHDFALDERQREFALSAVTGEWCAALDRAGWTAGLNTSASVPASASGRPVTVRLERGLVTATDGAESEACAWHGANVTLAGSSPVTLAPGNYRVVRSGDGVLIQAG